MPPRRREDRRRKLTFAQRMDLEVGCDPAAWESEDHRREAWAMHRDELMAVSWPDRPPEAFWQYEPGVPDELRDCDAAIGGRDVDEWAESQERFEQQRRAFLVG